MMPLWKRGSLVVAQAYEILWWLAFALALAGGGMLVWGYTRPLTQRFERTVPYRLVGELYYEASGPPELFPEGRVLPPNPLYVRLSREAMLGFRGEVQSEAPYQVSGQVRLQVGVQDNFGWRYVLWDETASWQDAWDLRLTLDLKRVEDRIRLHQLRFPEFAQYALWVVAELQAQGQVAGQPIQAVHEQQWSFQRTLEGLYALQRAQEASLRPAWEDQVTLVELAPNVVTLGTWSIPVARWRQIGWQVFAAGAVLWGLLQGWLTAMRTHFPRAYYLAALGREAIPVQPGPWLWSHQRYVPLSHLDALVDLAQRYQEPVLYAQEEDQHLFFVWLPDIVYFVREVEPPDRHAPQETEDDTGPMASEEETEPETKPQEDSNHAPERAQESPDQTP